MKKISLLFVMLLAFTVSTTAQSLPKPAIPELTEFIDYGFGSAEVSVGIDLGYHVPQTLMTQEPVADDYTIEKEFNDIEDDFTILDKNKFSISIYTDYDQIFTFTPEEFPQIDEATTQFPYNSRMPNGNFGYWDIHITKHSNIVENEGEERFFTWRIGIQTNYTDNGQTSHSDMYYMEVYPQLQEAKNVTSTSFLADWSCDAENTYILAGFRCYELYVIDKTTQEIVLQTEVDPTNPLGENGVSFDYVVPGAIYTVEGLTPGKTYQYYVVCSDYNNSFQSAVREVTLPETVYILGEVNEQGWAPNAGMPMEYDAEKNVYTATVTCDGRNSGYNYFSFTTRVAENNDQGGWDYIYPYRFGAVSEGDFLVTDEMLGIDLSMETNGDAYKIPAGEYKLTVDYANMTLIIEKIVPDHGFDKGDVNHDHTVNIADVTVLIDYLLGTGEVCEICADVNGDSNINIADVTALIDKLLNIN